MLNSGGLRHERALIARFGLEVAVNYGRIPGRFAAQVGLS
jgi:hypothetical protein